MYIHQSTLLPKANKRGFHLYTDIADLKSYYTHTYEGDDDMPASALLLLLDC